MRHFYDSFYGFKCSVAKTRLTLVFKLHLKVLIQSTKPLSFTWVAYKIVHLSYKQITVVKRNELLRPGTAQCCM